MLPAEDAGEAYGILGVLERHSGKVSTGAFCQVQAFQLAADSPRLKARTLRRIAMLVFFNGEDAESALEALQRARAIYSDLRDRSGVGKTLVDEAVVHSGCGDHELARSADREALLYLAKDEVEYRCAAVQGQAVSSALLGEIAEAKRSLDEVATPAGSLYLTATLRWLHGELALGLDQYDEATEHFLAVWDAAIELDFGPLEMALILLRVAKTYHLQGDRKTVRHTLREIIPLQGDLSGSLHSAALTEFLRKALEGELTADLLEGIYRELRKGTTSSAVPPLIPSS